MGKKIKFESYKYLFLRKISQIKVVKKNNMAFKEKIDNLEFNGEGNHINISLKGNNIMQVINQLKLYKKESQDKKENIKKYNDDLVNNDVNKFLRLIEDE